MLFKLKKTNISNKLFITFDYKKYNIYLSKNIRKVKKLK